jgi:glutathione S-transferase
MELVIGTKAWSTWSLRPWLVAKHAGLEFREIPVALRRGEATEAELLTHSGSGKAPVLKDDGLAIWDSMAICEYLAEKFPEARLWPTDPVARALGRSAAAEMHAGFSSLRGECPMDLAAHPHQATLSEATAKDIRRITTLWNDLLARFGGPYLLGEWSIVDAVYTPVASRFFTYGVGLSDYGDTGAAGAYAERLLQTPEFRAWLADI